jgi:phosphatidylserine/phosphatidylglycerophosphate/cardiolipin synthase-like enzyme
MERSSIEVLIMKSVFPWAAPVKRGAGVAMAATALMLVACAGPSLKKETIRFDPSYAQPPAEEGLLYDLANEFTSEHGPETSGFRLLDPSYDALTARLALIDSAVSSLDIQTYLWYPDHTGRIILERTALAANRAVHVRLNTRMHDKLLIADGRAAVVGGRNIGDHYFGLSHDYNFHDLDLQAKNRAAEELKPFGVEVSDWQELASQLAEKLHVGKSLLVYDETADNTIVQNVAEKMFGFMNLAQKELLITNAYIIPAQPSIDFIQSLTDRGVNVRSPGLAADLLEALNSRMNSVLRQP